MNKVRRQVIDEIKAKLEDLKSELEFVQEQEQEAFDNLPESLQGGERGQQMEEYVSKMQDAVSDLENALDNLEFDLCLYATLAVIGLMLTASDGIWFPALNCLGCLLFAIGCYRGEKEMKRSTTNGHL